MKQSFDCWLLISAVLLGLLCSPLHARIYTARADEHYPPFEYADDNGEPAGFTVDLLHAVATEMDLDIDLQTGPWTTIRTQLEGGEIDILTGMYRTPERDKLVDFSVPHYIATYSLFVPDGSSISGPDNLSNRTVLVQQNDLGHDFLIKNGYTNQIITRENWADVLTALKQGEADCALVSRLQGIRLLQELNIDDIKPVGSPVFQRKYGFAVKRGQAELLAELNEGLSLIKTSGEFDRIYENWFGLQEPTHITFTTALRYLAWLLAVLALIIGMQLLWNRILRQQINAKTAQISSELEERRKAEVAARESEKNLRITLRSIGDAVIATDVNGCVTRINPVAADLTGWDADEAHGHPLSEVFCILNTQTLHPIESPANRIIREARRIDLGNDILLVARDGTKRQIADSGTPITDENGHVCGAVIVFRDMTEHYRLEAQMHMARRLDSIGQLAGGIAHDFNNMLGGIIGAAEMIKSLPETNTATERYADIILQSSHKATHLIKKLMAFSRNNHCEMVPTDLHQAINDAISILENSLDKRVQIHTELNAARHSILGDAALLQNVIINLGINAAHAMPNGGSFTIRTNNDTSFSPQPDPAAQNTICIEAVDTGYGMTPEIIDHIFEPFFTTKDIGKGTGLGLSAVYGTIADHNGQIDVQSTPNLGSTFRIVLPLTQSAENPATATKPG